MGILSLFQYTCTCIYICNNKKENQVRVQDATEPETRKHETSALPTYFLLSIEQE